MNARELTENAQFERKELHCKGCDNKCLVVQYRFGGGQTYYSGNRCERVFSNGEGSRTPGRNGYEAKLHLLFDRAGHHVANARLRIGIPRALGLYEDFPFWHTLLTNSGIDVILSEPSNMRDFEAHARNVMSDNICFPAKLVHAHLADLQAHGVDRILLPFVVHGPRGGDQNSYNCPIVTGYSQVVQDFAVPIDAPVISMKDRALFEKQCVRYLGTLGVPGQRAAEAFADAEAEQARFAEEVAAANRTIVDSLPAGRLCIMLAGRPYHADPLIQHGVSELVASMGVDVVTDDVVRGNELGIKDVTFLLQWTYTNRILRAAKWCGSQGEEVQFVEFTSFGCGPDAFLTDALRDLLARYGKSLTLLKLDDISNVGSMKLRIRSLVDSLAIAGQGKRQERPKPFATTPPFEQEDRWKTILIPHFTPFLSPLLPAMFGTMGYKVISLPESDTESADIGLKYANNEVCYPATLVVGDIIRALQSGRYDLNDTAVAMSQTGGQCRASNYLSLIKKAMVDAGFGDIPVISVTFNGSLNKNNYQPGFKIDWQHIIPVVLYGLLYSDALAKLYYSAAVRETRKGEAARLKQHYLDRAAQLIADGRHRQLLPLAGEAAVAFDRISDDSQHPRAGIVGEIYLKFNSFAHHNLPHWLVEHGVEVVPPMLTDFFTQYFVNRRTNKASLVEKSNIPNWVMDLVYRLLTQYVKRFDKACAANRHYTPFHDIFEEAQNASEILTLSAQFGEGWLLPGEVATYYRHGVKNILSMQPFGCIANHIVVRGIEKKIKQLYPDINLLAVDFDGGVSGANILNRMLLFVDNIRE